MAFINSDVRILSIKDQGAFFPIGCLTSNPFTEGVEMLETTTRSSGGWKTGVPTKQFYNISFSGLQTNDTNGKVVYQRLREFKRNRQLVEWKMPGLFGFDDTGFGYITEIGEANDAGELLSFSGSLEGYGSPGQTNNGIWQDGDTILFQDGESLIFN